MTTVDINSLHFPMCLISTHITFSVQIHVQCKVYMNVCPSISVCVLYAYACIAKRSERMGSLHCRHVGVQKRGKFVQIVCIKMEVYAQSKILLFLYTKMAAMTSHGKHKYI